MLQKGKKIEGSRKKKHGKEVHGRVRRGISGPWIRVVKKVGKYIPRKKRKIRGRLGIFMKKGS